MIDVNIVTGFLGSGKTTIIKNLLNQFKNPEKIVWLKNEYGDKNIDELMLRETNVKVTEILNGCLCCVLVGRLGNALDEIIANINPERIIIETSGTAFPAPIVWEIAKKKDLLRVDSVINIIDCLNFDGYNDTSYSAKLQSKYYDLIILNKFPRNPTKSELLNLEKKLDDVYENNPHTTKIKSIDGILSADLLMGLSTISKSVLIDQSSILNDIKDSDHQEHSDHVETLLICLTNIEQKQVVFDFLDQLRDLGVIRAKGILNINGKSNILNWVYSKGEILEYSEQLDSEIVLFGYDLSTKKDQIFKLLAEINS